MSQVQEQELQATMVRLNTEMQQLKHQCQEMQSELQNTNVPQQTSSLQFRQLYQSLIRARNLIFLICDILQLIKRPSATQEEEESIQGSMIGKRQRLDTAPATTNQ